MTWPEWIKLHATAYGHHEHRDMEMLGLWAAQFKADGWTPDDLDAATRWILTHVEIKYRSDALAALVARLRTIREQNIGRQDEAETRGQGCNLCGWTGWVPVPDPAADRGGRFAVVLALCVCPLGRLRRVQGDQRPSVELWHQNWPDWRDRMQAHDKAVAARLRASEATVENDRKLGPVVARLLAQIAGMPADE